MDPRSHADYPDSYLVNWHTKGHSHQYQFPHSVRDEFQLFLLWIGLSFLKQSEIEKNKDTQALIHLTVKIWRWNCTFASLRTILGETARMRTKARIRFISGRCLSECPHTPTTNWNSSPKLSWRIAVDSLHFYDNSFAQFGMNTNPFSVWRGLNPLTDACLVKCPKGQKRGRGDVSRGKGSPPKRISSKSCRFQQYVTVSGTPNQPNLCPDTCQYLS